MTLPTNPIPYSTGAGTKNGVASEAQGRALSDELLPCPFCGTAPLDLSFCGGSTYRWLAWSCPGCGIGSEERQGPYGDKDRQGTAEAAACKFWNTRATPTDAAPAPQNAQALWEALALAYKYVTGEHTWHDQDRYFRHCEVIRAALTQSAPQASPQGDKGRDEVMAQAGATCLEFGFYGTAKPPEGHWLMPFWDRGRLMAAPLQAEPEASGNAESCTQCNGTGLVSDGLMYGDGDAEFSNGPIACVKDCPACTRATTATPAAREAESGS